MSAVIRPLEARFEAMQAEHIEQVIAIEQQAYSHPWTRGNFLDSLQAGYQAQMLMDDDEVLAYFVAMKGFEEVHLLNITVAPRHQRRGWGMLLLDALAVWARDQGAQWLWLEVRVSNERAIRIYDSHGYRRVGERKNYYPAAGNQREDALVMSLRL